MTIMMPGLIQAVRDAAQGHYAWCNLGEHDYETPEHEAQLCKSSSTVRFPRPFPNGDEVRSFEVELAGSPADVAHNVPVPLASLGFNGQIPGWDMEPWKLIPLAMTLLSAEARSRGDLAMERAYLDAANEAIDARVIEVEHAKDTVAQPPHHWSQGPFSYVMGGNPDDGVMTWDEYQAAQETDGTPLTDWERELIENSNPVENDFGPGVPRFVVQHTTPGHWQLTSIETGKSVDGIDYTSFDTARAERDLRNAEQAGGAR
ncbi:hypothetical protein KDL01_04215 [Actinospica durhamensis]|uniref:Uncharacterized protein n=1 Tax=Actinospica durhamensis TaxID=1508375 RepID=A0A941EKZ7_9ACTN|nr:hypothetical protein [Actinospica durhamensis]MBR7832447.1 hypothetical protein [Actinospica durhamensis]